MNDKIPAAPSFSADNEIRINENSTFVMLLNAGSSAKLDYSITGGDDKELFTINGDPKTLHFLINPDFEIPSDSNGDNIYKVEITAIDTSLRSDKLTLTIHVNNINDNSPVFIQPAPSNETVIIDVKENHASSISPILAQDADNDTINYQIVGGNDKAFFAISADNYLVFKSPPDFENALDGGANNTYSIVIAASDQNSQHESQQLIEIRVTDIPPATPQVTIVGDIQQIIFNWNADTNRETSFYRLFKNNDNVSGFSQVGIDIPSTTLKVSDTVSVHNHNWNSTTYRLDACDSKNLCVSTNVLTPDKQNMLDTIGYIKASNSGSLDRFGSSLAISSDGKTIAIGATSEDSGAIGVNPADRGDVSINRNAGAVYVYHKSGDNWSEQAYLKIPVSDPKYHSFGYSLALAANGNILAVGNYSSYGGDSSVYIYERINDQWTYKTSVSEPSINDNNGLYGYAVAFDNSGNFLIVGAPNMPTTPTFTGGIVYIYKRFGEVWNKIQYIRSPNEESASWFGGHLDVSGDGKTIAISAIYELSQAGAVYVYGSDNNIFTIQGYLLAPNKDDFDEFGSNLALSQNGNSLFISAFLEDSTANTINGNQNNHGDSDYNSGAVYLFKRTASGLETTWNFDTYFKPANSGYYDNFGSSIAISDDGNQLLVSSPYEDSDSKGMQQIDSNEPLGRDSGAAYLFKFDGLQWRQTSFIKAPNTGIEDLFGSRVAMSANGDTLVISATEESGEGSSVGNTTSVGDNNNKFLSGTVYLY